MTRLKKFDSKFKADQRFHILEKRVMINQYGAIKRKH
jgi:hypothetical protein